MPIHSKCHPPPLAFEESSSSLAGAFCIAHHLKFLALGPCAVLPAKYTPNVDAPHKPKNSDECRIDRKHRPCYTPYMETEQTHTILDMITVAPGALANLPALSPEVQEVVAFVYPPLTVDEETFCLAVIECGGNISAAYRMAFGEEVQFPLAKGKALLSMPAIALKIREITVAVEDASLISVGAHLDQLAKIRDLSIVTGQMKTAYQAERSRGEAVGIYQKHDANNKGKGSNNVQVNITMASEHDRNI